MKKTLALCAALAGSHAMAQTSNVTLYGIADASVRHASGLSPSFAPAAGSFSGLNSGVDNTSRWGLRGTEDLGGGLRALFLLEAGLNLDTGTSVNSKYFDRGSYLGLSGPWGTVTAGRQTTVLADAISPVDPLGMRVASFNPNINTVALSQHGLGIQFGSAGLTTGSYRLDNSVKYSGSFGPVTARAMYGFGEAAGSTSSLSSSGAGLAYASGDLAVSGAYQGFKDADGRKLEAYTLGASYRWGALRLAANAGRNKAQTSATAETVQRVLSAGGTFAATQAIDITAAYYKVDRSRTTARADGYGRAVVVGEYKLSRRTRLYAELDLTRWQDGYQGAGNKSRSTGASLGVMHTF
ncbi:porin [Xylophilus sp. GW821-FHT01B05]